MSQGEKMWARALAPVPATPDWPVEQPSPRVSRRNSLMPRSHVPIAELSVLEIGEFEGSISVFEQTYRDRSQILVGQDECAKFIYGVRGAVLMMAERNVSILPTDKGLWIPPGVTFRAHMIGDVVLRSIFVSQQSQHGLPENSQIVEISSLLRMLLSEAVTIPAQNRSGARFHALSSLLLDEIARIKPLPLTVPLPRDELLADRCRNYLRDPRASETIDAWAHALHKSRRSFTRMFRLETGLGFVTWRQQACLYAAFLRLAAGDSVSRTAIGLGYKNPAAFTSMFKRAFGYPPSRIWRQVRHSKEPVNPFRPQFTE